MQDSIKKLASILLSDNFIGSDALEFDQALATKSAALILCVPSVKDEASRVKLASEVSAVIPDFEDRVSRGTVPAAKVDGEPTRETIKKASAAIQVIDSEVNATWNTLYALFRKTAGRNALMAAAAPIVVLSAEKRMAANAEMDKSAMAVLRKKIASENAGLEDAVLDSLTKSACMSVYVDDATTKLFMLRDAVMGW